MAKALKVLLINPALAYSTWDADLIKINWVMLWEKQ